MIVGLEHVLTGEQLGTLDELALAIDRILYRQVVLLANDVVLQAMSRCSMHGAGTGFGGDVLAKDDRYLAIIKRMLQFQTFKRITDTGRHDLVIVNIPTGHRVFH